MKEPKMGKVFINSYQFSNNNARFIFKRLKKRENKDRNCNKLPWGKIFCRSFPVYVIRILPNIQI